MAYKTGNRIQQMFLPASIEEYVGPQDPVRVYDAFVDALNLKELGIPIEPQGSADEYYPKDMMKLIIYAYAYGIRSSRKIERACSHNLSFQWLLGGLKPDYRSIARFRSKYKEQIKKVLKQCVHLCIKLNLIEGNVLFTDGSKFRANASIHNTWTKEKCEKSLKKINEQIEQMVEECEQIDQQEEQVSLVQLREKIEDKEQLVQKMQKTLRELAESKKEKINTTDGDCVNAKSRQGTPACHNAQISVDNKHGLIVHAETVGQNTDVNCLADQLKKSAENLGKNPQSSCADSGYSSIQDLEKIDKEIQLVVPSKEQTQAERKEIPIDPFDKEQFQYAEHTDEYICPEGKRLSYSYFDQAKQAVIYQAQSDDCCECRHFGVCTTDQDGRRIKHSVHQDLQKQLDKIYRSPEGQQIYKLRKEKVEHPFGHMKRNLGAGQFMLRGKDKVDCEISILSTCFNIARMITIVGITELITKLQGS